jgi:hypothetical protein
MALGVQKEQLKEVPLNVLSYNEDVFSVPLVSQYKEHGGNSTSRFFLAHLLETSFEFENPRSSC